MNRPVTNWAGNVTFRAERLHRPSSLDDVQKLVRAAGRVRALGTGHSFSPIADTTGDLVSVAGLPPEVEIDSPRAKVRVAAGLRYGDVVGQLDDAGFGLPNLGSLPHISIAGACATGTHGSGDANRVLAGAVSEIELVTGTGDLVILDRETGGDDFQAAAVGLGALGVVTALTLDLVPAFLVEQYVYLDLPLSQLIDHFDEIMATGYSVSVFTGWQGPNASQVWVRRKTDQRDGWTPESDWLGSTRAQHAMHPVPGMPAENCTEQLGTPGPWYQRLPGFRLEFTPSSGDELQSEYLLPRRSAVDMLDALDRIRGVIAPALQVSEIRTVASDGLWLSPAYGRESVAIHFTWLSDLNLVTPALAAVEEALLPFGPRPHWGKLFGMTAESVGRTYERLTDFAHVVRRYDPQAKFGNEMLATYVTG